MANTAKKRSRPTPNAQLLTDIDTVAKYAVNPLANPNATKRILEKFEPSLALAFNKTKDIIDKHNETVELIDRSLVVDFDLFVSQMARLGYTSSAAARSVKWEELQQCGLPAAQSRMAADFFRRSGTTCPPTSISEVSQSETSVAIEDKVKNASIEQLLKIYSVKNPHNNIKVLKKLQELCGEHQCIVANDEGKVLIDETISRLETMKAGFQLPPFCNAGGIIHQVYKVGERSEQLFEENPLYPGTPLVKGICPRTGLNWRSVNKQLRQTVRIAVTETKELSADTPNDARNAYNAVTGGEQNMLMPEAVALWSRYEKSDELPSLIITGGDSKTKNGKPNDPFNIRT